MPITTAAILGGIQTATGIAQYIKGNRMAKNNQRPNYEIPAEIQQNLTQAQMQALEGLPAEQKKQYVDNIQRQQNFGLNALGDRKAGIAGLATLTQQGQDAYSNLLSQDAAARQSNLDKLTTQRDITAQYKDKQFELNKYIPFQEKAQAAQGLTGAGLQNAMGGLSSLQGTFENKALADAMKEGGQGMPRPGSVTAADDPAQGGFGNTNTLAQFNVEKMSNPYLTLEQFLKRTKGSGFANTLK